jgi:hypothetical protein
VADAIGTGKVRWHQYWHHAKRYFLRFLVLYATAQILFAWPTLVGWAVPEHQEPWRGHLLALARGWNAWGWPVLMSLVVLVPAAIIVDDVGPLTALRRAVTMMARGLWIVLGLLIVITTWHCLVVFPAHELAVGLTAVAVGLDALSRPPAGALYAIVGGAFWQCAAAVARTWLCLFFFVWYRTERRAHASRHHVEAEGTSPDCPPGRATP